MYDCLTLRNTKCIVFPEEETIIMPVNMKKPSDI
jgi:hypothetical protein